MLALLVANNTACDRKYFGNRANLSRFDRRASVHAETKAKTSHKTKVFMALSDI